MSGTTPADTEDRQDTSPAPSPSRQDDYEQRYKGLMTKYNEERRAREAAEAGIGALEQKVNGLELALPSLLKDALADALNPISQGIQAQEEWRKSIVEREAAQARRADIAKLSEEFPALTDLFSGDNPALSIQDYATGKNILDRIAGLTSAAAGNAVELAKAETKETLKKAASGVTPVLPNQVGKTFEDQLSSAYTAWETAMERAVTEPEHRAAHQLRAVYLDLLDKKGQST